MLMKKLVLVGALLSLLQLGAGIAHADSKVFSFNVNRPMKIPDDVLALTPEDVLGVKVGQTVAEAKEILNKKGYGNPKYNERTVKSAYDLRLETGFYSGSYVFDKELSWISDITFSNDAGENSDQVILYFSSANFGNRVIGINRNLSIFDTSVRFDAEKVLSQVAQKYGFAVDRVERNQMDNEKFSTYVRIKPDALNTNGDYSWEAVERVPLYTLSPNRPLQGSEYEKFYNMGAKSVFGIQVIESKQGNKLHVYVGNIEIARRDRQLRNDILSDFKKEFENAPDPRAGVAPKL